MRSSKLNGKNPKIRNYSNIMEVVTDAFLKLEKHLLSIFRIPLPNDLVAV